MLSKKEELEKLNNSLSDILLQEESIILSISTCVSIKSDHMKKIERIATESLRIVVDRKEVLMKKIELVESELA